LFLISSGLMLDGLIRPFNFSLLFPGKYLLIKPGNVLNNFQFFSIVSLFESVKKRIAKIIAFNFSLLFQRVPRQ